jgi:hypothetical protein
MLDVAGSRGIGVPIEGSVSIFADAVAVAESSAAQVIPEPTSLAIFGFCAVGMVGMGRRRKHKQR